MVKHTRQQALVLWVLWFSFLTGVIIYQFMLGRGIPSGENAPGAEWPVIAYVALAQLGVATVVRWLLLPRARTTGAVLVHMVLGIALCESVAFYGLFLVPENQPATKLTLWIVALVGVAQFAPIYALHSDRGSAFRQG
jgi:hypothetical protein